MLVNLGGQHHFEHQINEDQSQHGQSDQSETHHRSRVERNLESVADRIARRNRGADVSGGGDLHANVTGDDGEDAAQQEGDCGVPALVGVRSVLVVNQNADDHGEGDHEVQHVAVLLLEEGHCALRNGAVNADELIGFLGAINALRERDARDTEGVEQCSSQSQQGEGYDHHHHWECP